MNSGIDSPRRRTLSISQGLRLLLLALLLAACGRSLNAAFNGEEASQLQDTPPPTSSVARTPEPTFTPTQVALAADTPTSTPTPSPSLTATPAPTLTATPTLTPTRRPIPTLIVTPRLIYGGPSARKWIALSLDVEGYPQPLTPILDTLKEEGVRATFFIQGAFAEKYPALIKRIADEGHVIGSHSWSHADFRTLNREQMVEELQKTEEIILKITGQSTKPLFRPPYSYRTEESIQVVGEEGYLTVVWTTETYDWKKGATAETMVESVLEEARPGGIVVMHTSHKHDAEGLPLIIEALRKEGYEFATIPEVLAPPQ